MKTISTMVLMALTTLGFAQTKNSLPNFSEIEMEVPLKVELVQANEPAADAGANLNSISLEVKNQVLHIAVKGPADFSKKILIYYVQLNRIELNGAAEVSMNGSSVIKGESFSLETNGATKANLNLELTKFTLQATGASNIELIGKANKSDIEISGAANLISPNFKCQNTKVEASGNANFSVFAEKFIDVEASGISHGVFAGSPETSKIEVTGMANVVDANTGQKMTENRADNNDTTRLKLGSTRLLIIEDGKDEDKADRADKEDSEDGKSKDKKNGNKNKGMKKVYSGFEIGMGQFASPNLNMNSPKGYEFLDTKLNKSWFFGINILERDLQLVKNKVSIASGLGLEFQHFGFSNNSVLTPNPKTLSATSDSSTKYSMNRLYNFNINVPLLIKYAPRTRKGKEGFHLAAGVIGTYKATSTLRLENSSKGYDEELKIRDDFNANPFRVAATVRVGYGWFRAFASYSLTPYFKSSNGNPDVRVLQAGITVFPFN